MMTADYRLTVTGHLNVREFIEQSLRPQQGKRWLEARTTMRGVISSVLGL